MLLPIILGWSLQPLETHPRVLCIVSTQSIYVEFNGIYFFEPHSWWGL